ncbi:DinB family protein [Jeotgalibacillus malaysiensis]|uniref:DinB family protein n=1 Tax=Jeotgalibacillus malaysiensis TaxID=1508404 RepID=UPI003850E3F7
MIDLFLYNWQVRDDWFKWCKSLPEEELHAERTGGMRSLFQNLVHIIDCELLWINYLVKDPVTYEQREMIRTLDDLIVYSDFTKDLTQRTLSTWNDGIENKSIQITSSNGKVHSFTYEKVIKHLITHEVHHIGQCSVWAREIGRKPVSPDLIVRDYK